MSRDFILVDFENVQPGSLGALDAATSEVRIFAGEHQKKVDLALAKALQALGPRAEYIQIAGSGKDALDFHIAFYIGRLSQQHPDARFTIVSRDTGFDPLVKHLAGLGIACRRIGAIAVTMAKKTMAATPAKAATKKVAKAVAVTVAPTPVAAPRKAAPQKNMLQKSTPQESTPQESTPQESTSQKSTPKKAAKAIAKSVAKPLVKATGATSTARPADAHVAKALAWLGKVSQNRPGTIRALRASIANLFKPGLETAEIDALLAQLARSGQVRIEGNRVTYALRA
jgi:hypothetical protein